MNLVQNAKTKLKDPHAHKARSFKRNTADNSPLPNTDTSAAHNTSQAKEKAKAFLKYKNCFLISSMLSLQAYELFQRAGVSS